MPERNPITSAIREAIYPFNSRVEVITALAEVLLAEQQAYHKTMAKQLKLTELVENLRLAQFTSKASKRKRAARPKNKTPQGRNSKGQFS